MIQVLSGDFAIGEWEVRSGCFYRKTGIFSFETLPIGSIVHLLKMEETNRYILVDVTFSSGQHALMKMNDDLYLAIIAASGKGVLEEGTSFPLNGTHFRYRFLIYIYIFGGLALPAFIFGPSKSEVTNQVVSSHSTSLISKVCKAAIATVMQRSPEGIVAQKSSDEIILLSYQRESDGSSWSYRCKVSGNSIIWASSTGRWRDDPLDSKISFSNSDNLVQIAEKHSDGSVTTKSFSFNQLE